MLSLNQPSALFGVKVGILRSPSGTLALSGSLLLNVELMAIASGSTLPWTSSCFPKTNGNDFVECAIAQMSPIEETLRFSIEPLVVDGASNPTEFEPQLRKLIQSERVTTRFCCWIFATRQVVKVVFRDLEIGSTNSPENAVLASGVANKVKDFRLDQLID